MAGASVQNMASKLPQWVLPAVLWSMLCKVLGIASYKLMQVLVGTGFLVLLNVLAAISFVQRFIATPQLLHKVKRRRLEPVQLIEASLTVADTAQFDGSGCGDKSSSKPPIIIRAVASTADTVKPVILHNEPGKGHQSEAWRLVGPYMKLYGRNAIANSQLFNPEFLHFFVPGMGSLPFVVADIYNRAMVCVIGDPLTQKDNWKNITGQFLKEFPDTYFYHASAEYAALLHDLGYYINDVGAETTLQIQSWTYSGKTRTIRAAARSARDAGVRVRELRPEELTEEMRRQLQHDVSGDWLQQKAVADRELRVFVRNVDYDNLQLQDGVRIFVAEQYDPAVAPPAVVDQAIQGVPANAKPPKPPRNKSSRSLASQASLGSASLISQVSGVLSRSSSLLSHSSSTSSLSALAAFSGSSRSGSSPRKSEHAGVTSPKSETEMTGMTKPELSKKMNGVARGNSVTFADYVKEAETVSLENVTKLPNTVSPFQDSAAAAAAPAGDADDPELLGFVLLDPLWEGGHEVGYVSSICRMKRTAHQGTLKLLYEDIISKLRSEGRKELAFGFAPFFNVRDDRFSRIVHWIRWTNLYLYNCANNLYAFQNLAFSKIRYGAGVDGDKFRDPNVAMSHIYMASRSPLPGIEVLDLYVLCMYVGFMGEMFDTWLKLVGLKRGGANLVVEGMQTSPSECLVAKA